MFSEFKLLIVFIVSVYGVPLPKECGISLAKTLVDWRIVGGKDAAVGEFPWFSVLGTDKQEFCGSSIINERWIMTAGHCLPFNHNTTLMVRLGVHNVSLHEQNEVDVYIEKIVPHPQWSYNTLQNDLALLKMKESLDFKGKHKQLRPICLSRSDTKLTKKCVAYGLGMVSAKNVLPPSDGILKKLDTYVSDGELCQKKAGKFFNQTTQICTVTPQKGGESTCVGDSGGPIQCQGEDNRWYQVGVVSFGSGDCGAPNVGEVFTRVSAYVDWIEKTIANN